MKKLITLGLSLFAGLSVFGQNAIQRTPLTTNAIGSGSAGQFLGWGTPPSWQLPPAGGPGISNVFTTNGVGQNGVLNAPIGTAAYASTNTYVATNAVNWVRVFSDGTAYNRFGKINTAGTTTSGLNEAVHALYQTNALGIGVGGGSLWLEPGVYFCSGQVLIPNQFNFELSVRGSGKGSTLLVYTGTTNFIQLEKTTGTDAANGGTKPFSFQMRDVGFTYQNDTNLAYLIYFQDKVNQCFIENCAFSSMQCIQFTGLGEGNIQGQGGGLLFIGGVPTNAVGVVGIRLDGGSDNKSLIRKCDFYGLAAGVIDGQDHATLEDNMFSEIGKWWSGSAPAYTAHYGTAWAVVSNNLTASGLTNTLHQGAGIIDTGHIYDMQVINCYFMDCNAWIANINLTGGAPQTLKVINPYGETSQYQIIHGVTQDDDASPNTEIIFTYKNVRISMPIPYIYLTNGVISTTAPTTPASDCWHFHFGDKFLYDNLGAGVNIIQAYGANGLVQFNASQITNAPAAALQLTKKSLVGRSAAGVGQEITIGSGLDLSGTTLTATGVGGGATNAVTSVWSNGVAIAASGATNLNFIGGTNINISITNNNSGQVDVAIREQDGGTPNQAAKFNAQGNPSDAQGLISMGVAGNPGTITNLLTGWFTNMVASSITAGRGTTATPGNAGGNGTYTLVGTNGHFEIFGGVNSLGADLPGWTDQRDNIVAAYHGTNYDYYRIPQLITNINVNLLPTDWVWMATTTNGGAFAFMSDGKLNLTNSGGFAMYGGAAGAATAITFTEGTAPGTPAAGFGVIYADGTTHQFTAMDNNSANVSVMVRPDAGAANNFLTAISTAGVISKARPTIANVDTSGAATFGSTLDVTGNLSGTNQVIAQGWQNYTNLFSGTLFPTGTNYNISLSSNFTFTGVSLVSTKNESYGKIMAIATGTVTVTNPASWYASDGLTNRTLTNGNLGEMIVKVIPGFATNFTFNQYWHP